MYDTNGLSTKEIERQAGGRGKKLPQDFVEVSVKNRTRDEKRAPLSSETARPKKRKARLHTGPSPYFPPSKRLARKNQ
jgi:hypothetical protein